MKKEDYVFASSCIRMQEKKLLSKNKLTQLIETDKEKIVSILSDSIYSEYFSKYSLESYEKILELEEKKLTNLLTEISVDKNLIEIFMLEKEYENIKLRIKGLTYSESIEYFDVRIKTEKLKNRIESDFNEIYLEFLKNKDYRKMSIMTDKKYLDLINDLKDNIGLEMINEYVHLTILKYNILTALRLEKTLTTREIEEILYSNNFDIYPILKYLETKDFKILKSKYDIKGENIFDIVKELDKKNREICEKHSKNTYGEEVLISFYINKMYEINALRLIFTAKVNNIGSENIKRRLRGYYV